MSQFYVRDLSKSGCHLMSIATLWSLFGYSVGNSFSFKSSYDVMRFGYW